MYSVALYVTGTLNSQGSLLEGWTINAVILAVLGSSGGILVALTMKYTDAVLKTFATSGAIILCTLVGFFFLGAPLDIPIGVGAICTVLALLNYGDNGGTPSSTNRDTKGAGAAVASTSSSTARFVDEESSVDDESSQMLLSRRTLHKDSAL